MATAPTVVTTPVTDSNGDVLGVVAAIDGDGDATVSLPPNVGLPAIVHAQYRGSAKFVVTAVDTNGRFLSIAAQSLGSYDGTFPVGFVDQHNAPTGGLSVATTGRWHLDITEASFAPRLPRPGVSGLGDAVLSYTGPTVRALVTFAGTSTFTIETFANGVVNVLTDAAGPVRRLIVLPPGPAFISVTAAGNWSMKLE
ncbi:MAG: hypothetical protein ACLPVY_17515 [Acidimicrobiia bacterium]